MQDNTTNQLLYNILQEIKDRRDKGKALYNNGTLSTTNFKIINTLQSPGHEVKGYSIKNTTKSPSTDSFYIAHNITEQPEIDVDIIDTLKTNPIFTQLTPGEVENIRFNVRCIKSVHLLAVSGNPTYKIKLVW